jgi:hypothetical protein
VFLFFLLLVSDGAEITAIVLIDGVDHLLPELTECFDGDFCFLFSASDVADGECVVFE